MSQGTFPPIGHGGTGTPFVLVVAPLGIIAAGLIAAAELALGAGIAIARRLRSAWLRRRTARMLAALDDHLLRDIGVARGDIRTVAERCVIRGTDRPRRTG
jgi:uncharacterized protein YjiS (DUF1127 family)